MKRALAERAKQSGHANGMVTSMMPSNDQPQPPRKIPKVEYSQDKSNVGLGTSETERSVIRGPETPRQNNQGHPPTSPYPKRGVSSGSVKGRGSMKRQRTRALSEEKEDEEQPNSAFFLKHQNSALVSELKQLQHKIRFLEEERDYRRQQCDEAGTVLRTLEATWTKMEYALKLGTKQIRESGKVPQLRGDKDVEIAPSSTGTGGSVERIGLLLDSLAALGKDRQIEVKPKSESNSLNGIARIASLVTRRAQTLQEWIWAFLSERTVGNAASVPVTRLAELQGEISILKSQCRDYKGQITELAKSRDEALESDRKVRRGLYRLSSGRMNLDEVLKAVEEHDKEGLSEMLAVEESLPIKQVVGSNSNEGTSSDSEELTQLRKRVQDMEEIAYCRLEEINKLREELNEKAKRINDLSIPAKLGRDDGVDEMEVKRSKVFVETSTELVIANRELSEMRTRFNVVKERWAQAKGIADAAAQTVEELVSKHKRRWAEVVGESCGPEDSVTDEMKNHARKQAETENKLTQALENVRQAENSRITLSEAISLNSTLQAKLDAKTASLASGRPATAHPKPSSDVFDGGKDRSSAATPAQAEGKSEKLYKENRRMRKELAAAVASKESAKAKVERAEREKEALIRSNSRLLKQSVEKDDINAKSLSTVLHLKGLTEELKKEKAFLEQEMKSSSQLNLATRLAENARERLSEVMARETEKMNGDLASLQEVCEGLRKENDEAVGKIANKEAEIQLMVAQTSKLKSRCDELVAEAASQFEKRQQLTEALAISRKENAEAARQIAKARGQDCGAGREKGSEFTTEQLSTQISVLKSRLACPVCNVRDKKCILLRCRHMFCRQCVDENVRNRSRKCPACGQRFDNKDVEDIWL